MHPTETESNRRDDLAVIRTQLANERTALAYVRTSLMVAATAVTIVKFFPEVTATRPAAIALGGLSGILLIAGGWRYRRLGRNLRP